MGSGHNRLVLYDARRPGVGARRRARGTRCRGTSTRPTGAPGATPSTRSGARATTSSDEHAAPDRAAARQIAARDATRVVIGSGPERARRRDPRSPRPGASVLVLEAADAPGGAVRTEELTLPGFRHDTFSSVYPAAAASPVFARMPLERHGLRVGASRATATRTRCPDGRAARARTATSTRRPRRSTRCRRATATRGAAFVAPVPGALRRACAATMLSGFPPLAGPLKLLAARGPSGLLEFARLLLELGATALGQRLFARRRRARLALRRGRCTATCRRTARAARSPPST